MEQYGNLQTYNLESVLKTNIVNSDYYRNDCLKLTSWSEVIDQIFYDVKDVEPWMGGNVRGPSSAFCLLFRLFTLKPTEDEINDTITHGDSPFIRAVGFLYLRYVCDPRKLWEWLRDYVDDKEEFKPTSFGGNVTMGDYVRDLVLEQYYFETIFPRIPKTVEGDIITDLKARGLPTSGKGNGGAGGPDRRGLDEGNKRPASVKASLSVAFGQRAPNRAGARDDRVREALRQQADKGGGSREGGGSKQQQVRSRSRSPGRNRGSSRDGAPGGYRNGSDYRDRGRDDRYGGRSTQPPRSRSRSRDRGRDDPRANGRGSSRDGYDRRDDYGSRYDRQQQRGGGYRSRSRSPGGYRGGGRRSSRSRSRERGGGGGRSAAEVFGGGAAAFGRPKTDVFSKYADAGGGAGGGASAAAKFGTGEVLRLGPKKPVVFSGKY